MPVPRNCNVQPWHAQHIGGASFWHPKSHRQDVSLPLTIMLEVHSKGTRSRIVGDLSGTRGHVYGSIHLAGP